MSSTDAGTPEPAGNGAPPLPPAEPRARRGLRDSVPGRIFLLALVLVGALLVSRTCGSNNQEISQEEAIEIAKDNAAFEPCPEQQCVQIRFIQRGIPVQAYWGVVLSDELDDEGQPNRIESFLIDVVTGDVSRP
jgi:hypothetical protein